MISAKSHRYEGLVLGAAFLLAGLFWVPWGAGDSVTTAARQPTWILPNDPQSAIGALAKRPLLDPARGQKSAAAAGAVTTGERTSDANATMPMSRRYLLRGLARVDERAVAVIEDVVAKRFLRLRHGQAVGDWYLASVSGTDATLKNQDGAEERLVLEPALPRVVATARSGLAPSTRPNTPPTGLPYGPVTPPAPSR